MDFQLSSPMVKLKARPPVWGPKQSLQSTGEIDKHVAHQEKPEEERDKNRDRSKEGSQRQ